MKAGRLRHRVTLQRGTVTANSHGDQVRSYVDLRTVWADVEALGGREFLAAEHVQAEVTSRITLRAQPDITLTPADRIVWGSRIFDIRHVIDLQGRSRDWQVMASEFFA
ncbi:MAG: hypothetical protein RIR91_223 [Verrucomicrobiota bacterium]